MQDTPISLARERLLSLDGRFCEAFSPKINRPTSLAGADEVDAASVIIHSYLPRDLQQFNAQLRMRSASFIGAEEAGSYEPKNLSAFPPRAFTELTPLDEEPSFVDPESILICGSRPVDFFVHDGQGPCARLQAAIAINQRDADHPIEVCLTLLHLFVSKDRRRQGISAELMRHFLTETTWMLGQVLEDHFEDTPVCLTLQMNHRSQAMALPLNQAIKWFSRELQAEVGALDGHIVLTGHLGKHPAMLTTVMASV